MPDGTRIEFPSAGRSVATRPDGTIAVHYRDGDMDHEESGIIEHIVKPKPDYLDRVEEFAFETPEDKIVFHYVYENGDTEISTPNDTETIVLHEDGTHTVTDRVTRESVLYGKDGEPVRALWIMRVFGRKYRRGYYPGKK